VRIGRLTPLRTVAAIAATGLVTTTTVALTGTASAASADVLISQVYGGGGNSGATYTNDFVELHNVGAAAVDISGWSVQYGSAGGTTYQTTALSGTVQPGAFYLVSEGAGAGGTTPLPTPDATGSIALSATAGKVALVTSATALGCGSSCAAAAGVHDFVGYGGANDAETAPAPAPSNTTSVARADGAADTDNNAADFAAGPPNPRNSSSGPGGPPGVPDLRIHDVQGAAHVSPYAGQRVLAVPGTVIAKSRNGYWFQDPQPDADPATSDGLFVFTGSAPTVSAGDSVTVTGTVAEFRAGGASGTNLATTELSGASTTVLASGQPLPAPTLVGSGGRVPPGTVIEDDATGSVETSGVFDPASDGIDFWESLEGMRVELDDAAVVGPTNQFGETPVVPAGSGVRTARGGIVLRATDANPERIVIAGTLAPPPSANVGDTLAGATVGVVDYAFSNFELLPTATPTVAGGGLAREVTRVPRSSELAVATFNVENLDPGDPQDKFDRLAAAIVTNLAAPDLVALEEVQDDTGPTDDGVVTAGATLTKLTAAIGAAGGPSYQWREIDPVNDTDGGEPGGNIRVVLLFRTDRGLSFVDRPGGTATSDTQVVIDADGKPQLSASPGRLAPTDAAWTTSRKPLAGEFRWHGKVLFAIANHFNSKGGDQPLYGRFQPPQRSSETQRHKQAHLVHDFAASIMRADPSAAVVVLGDLNDFDYSETADILAGDGLLTDLPRTLPLPERYTYVFEGNSQVLDHILLSRELTLPTSPGAPSRRFEYDVVHVNSEFTDQVSDHEPQVVRLRF
jgi:predicted extracellular nuclease